MSSAQHIGYKKAEDGSIITLEIIGSHNESRSGVVDAQHALFRCSKAKVLAIDHPTKGKIDCVFCENDPKTLYKVGIIVKSPKVNEMFPMSFYAKQSEEDVNGDFGSKSNVVFGEGLHYYLSREAADSHRNFGTHIHSGLTPKKEEKTWHASNGRQWRVNHFDGDCLHMEWAENGQLIGKYQYKYGKNSGFFGVRETWYNDGTHKERVEYSTKSRKHGISQTWHPNGVRKSLETFHKGKLHGKSVTWLPNGKMWNSINYKNGLKNGVPKYSPTDDSFGFTKMCYKGFYLQGKRVNRARYLLGKLGF